MVRQENINTNIPKRDTSNTKTDSNTTNQNQNASNIINLRQRKDGKGIPIIKKNKKKARSKHHAYFVDKINPGKDLTDVVKIESYKNYNRDDYEEEDEEEFEDNGVEKNENKNANQINNSSSTNNNNNNESQKIEEKNVVRSEGCCQII